MKDDEIILNYIIIIKTFILDMSRIEFYNLEFKIIMTNFLKHFHFNDHNTFT